jgi:hypothetical protein
VATKTAPERNARYLPLAAGVMLAAVIGGGVWWFFLRGGPQSSAVPTLTDEMKVYVRSLRLSDVEMKATENYVKHTIVEIVGKIGNTGDRTLKTVEINCVFYNRYGEVCLRERLPIVRSKFGGPLKPGEVRTFRLPFDNLPESWNQGSPQMIIAHIDFEK